MTEYTRLRNKNRGYMKLRVWHKSIELYKLVCKIVYTENQIDYKLHEVENNLWRLLESLEKKRDEGSWVTRASDDIEKHHPE